MTHFQEILAISRGQKEYGETEKESPLRKGKHNTMLRESQKQRTD